MVKFQQGNLSDMDVIGCFVLASTENGLNEIEFDKLLKQRKSQVGEEIVRLREEVLPEMSRAEFEKQGMIYLLSQENDCSLVEASEIYEKLEEERNTKSKGAFGKIAKALETPKYGSPTDVEKLQKEKVETSEIEWVHAGTVKLERLKKKYKIGGE